MKQTPYIFLCLSFMLSLALAGCSSDSVSSGNSVLDWSDSIIVKADTFALTSSLIESEHISCTSDSFLLGEVDNLYGTIHADILTQIACPIGFEYPEGAEVDSTCLYLYYSSWYGDGRSPMDISVYEMDKATFRYSDRLYTDIDASQYWSGDPATRITRSRSLVVPAEPTDSAYASTRYIYYVRVPLSDDFTQRFFAARDYSSQEAFCEAIKGLYITSEFGCASMLNVSGISLALYYHYSYDKAGRDTTVTDIKTFFSNTEVRHANAVQYFNSQIELLKILKDDYNFAASPANCFTSIDIPLSQLTDTIRQRVEGKRAYVNRARIYVEVLNYSDEIELDTRDTWAAPASEMLLIKQESMDRFFSTNELPTDTCALLSTLATTMDSLGTVYYYYTYDLSTLLTQQLREQANIDTLHMLLVPVDVTYTNVTSSYYGYSSSSSTMTAIGHKQGVSSTIIRSARNQDDPMDLEVVYSGF